MKILKVVLIFSIICLGLASCTKKDVEIIHENAVVTGNESPPYSEIPTILIEAYVNKLYIDLVARQPSETELANDVQNLKADTLNEAARLAIITRLQQTSEYYNALDELMRSRFLNSVDTISIRNDLDEYRYDEYLYDSLGLNFQAQAAKVEGDRLQAVLEAPIDYQSGLINFNEYNQRLCLNDIYDDINMGADNFVLACYETMFGRLPNGSELDDARSMVYGGQRILYGISGASKTELVTILTTIDEFYEGLIYNTYLNILVRQPTDLEISERLVTIKNDKRIENLQADLLKTDEYAGF